MKGDKAYLILEFPTKRQKSEFVGGLLDGWGESAPIDVSWDYTTLPGGESRPHGGDAPLLRVKVRKDDL